MAKKKKAYTKSNSNDVKMKERTDSPFGQKFALLFFGIGPILLVIWFLSSRGFFEPL